MPIVKHLIASQQYLELSKRKLAKMYILTLFICLSVRKNIKIRELIHGFAWNLILWSFKRSLQAKKMPHVAVTSFSFSVP